MSPAQFRKIALSFTNTVEAEHVGHPDFRCGGKIYASLGVPTSEWGMIKLTAEQQKTFCDTDDAAFQPCTGAWGRRGYTNVRLSLAKTAVVRSAMTLAVENVARAVDLKLTKKSSPRSDQCNEHK